MAKCLSCGKNFDYEKYYGICPKCGAYNRKETAVDEHKELHEQYDSTGTTSSHYDNPYDMTGIGTQFGASDAYRQTNTYNSKPSYDKYNGDVPQAKNSPLAIIIFVVLILGIIGTIAMPIIYSNESMWRENDDSVASMGTVSKGTLVSEDEETTETNEGNYSQQTAQVVEAAPGETCYLGQYGDVEVTVESARVLIPAGQVKDFPENENLVAISVSFDNTYEEFVWNDPIEKLYVGYGEGIFKETVNPNNLDEYSDVLEGITQIGIAEMCMDAGEGVILVFVPEDVTNIDMFLESRNEDSLKLIEIYAIPLEIQSEEGM